MLKHALVLAALATAAPVVAQDLRRPSQSPASGAQRQAPRGALVAGPASGFVAGSVATCPAPFKLASGACVRACPGGYDDRGSICVSRRD